MTVIVFLIDNSASMAMRMVNGINYMDFARQFVENFLKQRQRDPISKADRYMLMGFDEFPANVKSGWREAQSHFNEQLRLLRPTADSTFNEAFLNAVRFVNLNRVQTGIENYGYGRYPSFTEPVNFIALVDYNSLNINPEPVELPKQPLADLTDEPYRWDHRLYVVALDAPGHNPLPPLDMDLPSDEEPTEKDLKDAQKQLEDLVEKCSGKVFRLTNPKNLTDVLDQVLKRIQVNGVYIWLEKQGNDPPPPKNPIPEPPKEVKEPPKPLTTFDSSDYVEETSSKASPEPEEIVDEPDAWKKSVVLIHRSSKAPPNAQSSWPIPEAFWPDANMTALPPRTVYPEVRFRCEQDAEQVSTPGFPFDKYEVEPGALTRFVLGRRDPSACWQLFVHNSYKQQGMGFPFGYVKAASNLQTVNLFVFPYNYPLLFAIIEESKDARLRTSEKFRQKVDRYFSTIPNYYVMPLRKCLKKFAITHPLLDGDGNFHFLHFSIMSQFSKAKQQGKEEYEKTCNEVTKLDRKPFLSTLGILPLVTVVRTTPPDTPAQKRIGYLSTYKQQIVPLYEDAKIAVTETKLAKDSAQRFLNPYLIERDELVDQLERMRVNLDQHLSASAIPVLEGGLPGQRIRLQHAEDLHAQPIVKMGDFNLYAKRLLDIGLGPMRDFEPPQAKPHAFGNPFKLDKKSMTVDEVPELNEGPDTSTMNGNAPANGNSSNGNGAKKEEPRDPRKRAASEPPNGNAQAMKRRKAGPLDRDAVMRWKQRRANNDWDGRSVCSDLAYTADLTDADLPAKRARYAASEPGDLQRAADADDFEEEEAEDQDAEEASEEAGDRLRLQPSSVDEIENRSPAFAAEDCAGAVSPSTSSDASADSGVCCSEPDLPEPSPKRRRRDGPEQRAAESAADAPPPPAQKPPDLLRDPRMRAKEMREKARELSERAREIGERVKNETQAKEQLVARTANHTRKPRKLTESSSDDDRKEEESESDEDSNPRKLNGTMKDKRKNDAEAEDAGMSSEDGELGSSEDELDPDSVKVLAKNVKGREYEPELKYRSRAEEKRELREEHKRKKPTKKTSKKQSQNGLDSSEDEPDEDREDENEDKFPEISDLTVNLDSSDEEHETEPVTSKYSTIDEGDDEEEEEEEEEEGEGESEDRDAEDLEQQAQGGERTSTRRLRSAKRTTNGRKPSPDVASASDASSSDHDLDDVFDDGKDHQRQKADEEAEEEPEPPRPPPPAPPALHLTRAQLPDLAKPHTPPAKPDRLSRYELVGAKCGIKVAVRSNQRDYDAFDAIQRLIQRASVRERCQLWRYAELEARLHRQADLQRRCDAEAQRLAPQVQFEDGLAHELALHAPASPPASPTTSTTSGTLSPGRFPTSPS